MPEVLIAADADHVHDEVEAALAGPEVTFRHLRRGQEVLPSIEAAGEPDLVVLDLQIGNMGGMACCMNLRLEEGAGRLSRLPVIMLLDRPADEFLARRSQADAWFVKPVNPIKLRTTAERLLEEAEQWWAAQDIDEVEIELELEDADEG